MIAQHQSEDIHNWFLRLHAHAHTLTEVCVLADTETVSIIPSL